MISRSLNRKVLGELSIMDSKRKTTFPYFCRKYSLAAVCMEKKRSPKSLYLSRLDCTFQKMKKKCLECELDPEDDDMLDLLSSYKCYRKPSKENIKGILEELAPQELIQKPRYVANIWTVELKSLKSHPKLCDINSLSVMFSEKKPTSKRIIKLFNVEPKSDSERACFDHFKRYIKSLNENMLAAFLQFLTGSDIITVEKVELSFNATDGVGR